MKQFNPLAGGQLSFFFKKSRIIPDAAQVNNKTQPAAPAKRDPSICRTIYTPAGRDRWKPEQSTQATAPACTTTRRR